MRNGEGKTVIDVVERVFCLFDKALHLTGGFVWNVISRQPSSDMIKNHYGIPHTLHEILLFISMSRHCVKYQTATDIYLKFMMTPLILLMGCVVRNLQEGRYEGIGFRHVNKIKISFPILQSEQISKSL